MCCATLNASLLTPYPLGGYVIINKSQRFVLLIGKLSLDYPKTEVHQFASWH